MKKIVSLLPVLALTFMSISAVHAWDNGGVSNAQVKDITVLQNGSFYITFDKDICDSGVNKVGYVYVGTTKGGVPWTKEGADMLLKTATAAFLAGKSVKVYADDSGSNWGCQLGAIKLQ